MFDKTKAPANLADYPEFSAATDELNELRAEDTRIERALEAHRLSHGAATRTETQARAMLSSQGSVAVADAPAIPLETIDELTRRRPVVREAITLQERRLEKLRSDACRAIATTALPEYQGIVREMVEAFAPFGAACEKEAAFRERFIEDGISFASVISPVPLNGMRQSVYASDVNRWLDQIEHDYGIVVKNRRRAP